jgi:hypothetical protein
MSNKFISIIVSLSSVLRDQEITIMDLEDRAVDLNNQLNEKDQLIDSLKYQAKQEVNVDYCVPKYQNLLKERDELDEENRNLRFESPRLRTMAEDRLMSVQGLEWHKEGKKIQAIKEIREITRWGLKNAKGFVEEVWAKLDKV